MPKHSENEQETRTTLTIHLGNPAPKEAFKQEVASDATREEMEREAKKLGVAITVSTENLEPVDDDILRERLNGASRFRPIGEGAPAVTTVSPPPGTSVGEAFITITHPKGVWASHALMEDVEVPGAGPDGKPGIVRQPVPPAWVECDNPQLANLLADHYGCPVGAPEDLEATHTTSFGPPGYGPDGKIGGSK